MIGVLTSIPTHRRWGLLAVLAGLLISVALGFTGALLNTEKHSFPEASGVPNHDAFTLTMWATLLVAAVLAGAVVYVALGDTRSFGIEAGFLFLSVFVGAVISWFALSVFVLAFFLPFIVGLGSREIGDVHAVLCFQFEEGCTSAGDEFLRVFAEYILLVPGVLGIVVGAAAGALGCMSRWRRST
jgi:hypothetical protein